MSRRRKSNSRRPSGAGPRPNPRGPSAERRPPGPEPGAGGPGDRARAEAAIDELALLASVDPVVAARAALRAAPAPLLLDVASSRLAVHLTRVWSQGWQPSELLWHARRQGGPQVPEVLVALVAADAVTVAACDVHPLWRAQLTELGITPTDSPTPLRPRWLHDAVEPSAGGDEAEAVAAALAAVGFLAGLPPLERLVPPPGRPDLPLSVTAPPLDAAPMGIDGRVLERVRALLAKAESTSFEAEAQAFTAKAHELMTRHSLEHALVTGVGAGRERPTARRVLIDDPYADAKALLLQVIAEASRCRAVQLGGLQMSTVVGFEADLAGVEVLYTSLLVQAQAALQALAQATRAGARERSRGFRSSFLRGFALRIGDRLDVARSSTEAAVDRDASGALVPVLAARDAEVDDQVHALFPRLRTSRGPAVADALGWQAGSAAAERADLPWAPVAAPADR